MKSMNDIKAAMSKLYVELDSGAVELKTAAELANIAGKFLKAEQLMLAREIFEGSLGNRAQQKGRPAITADQDGGEDIG